MDRPFEADRLYERYGNRIHDIANRLAISTVDAEDITQETLLRLLRNGDATPDDPNAWVYVVTLNATRSFYRAAKKHRHQSLSELPSDESCGQISVEHEPCDVLADHEIAGAVRKAVYELPEPYRDVTVMTQLMGVGLSEYAHLNNLNENTAKSHNRRAKIILKEALANLNRI